ncbi:hypothetical protein DQ04_08801010 [Trypanosoma grayi]|uniref:hypothetical protein n=1 Tax=Trypanosoma grayi TaxID=71804 RepID=UPI0004F412A0|nr:hypothetical protein DQ04_08801010 [Trypanosoma grayi]KEG07796.1 hypothetical protein DQ04_08801010 [Trypanosoma grayi]
MDRIGASVAKTDRHLTGIEQCLGQVRRHSARRPSHTSSSVTLGIPPVAHRSDDAQQHSSSSVLGDSNRRMTASAASVAVKLPPSPPTARRESSRPLDPRMWQGRSTTSSAPLAQVHPSHARGRTGDVKVHSTARMPVVLRRRRKPDIKHKMDLLSSSSTSLLSSSSSTLEASSTSSIPSRSPSPMRGRQSAVASTVSSSLTSLTLFSFSSMENSPAAEIATRWQQWRQAAYHLLASHYEKCHGALTCAVVRRGRRGFAGSKSRCGAVAESVEEEREKLTTSSDSSDSIEEGSEGEQQWEASRAADSARHGAQLYAAANEETNRDIISHGEALQATDVAKLIQSETVVAVERGEARARGEPQRPKEDSKGRREMWGQLEGRHLTQLLETAHSEATVDIGRNSARMQRGFERLYEEEEALRDAVEQKEDERLTDLLEAMDRDAWAAAEREAARLAGEFAARPVTAEAATAPPTVPPLAPAALAECARQTMDRAVQTPEHQRKVRATQTDGVFSGTAHSVVQKQNDDERMTACADGSRHVNSQWQQLYLQSEGTQTGGDMSCEAVGVQTNLVAEAEDGEEMTAACSIASPRYSRGAQTPVARHVSSQAGDGLSQAPLAGAAAGEEDGSTIRLVDDNTRPTLPSCAVPSRCDLHKIGLEEEAARHHTAGTVEEPQSRPRDSLGPPGPGPRCASPASSKLSLVDEENEEDAQSPREDKWARAGIASGEGKLLQGKRPRGQRDVGVSGDAHVHLRDSSTNDDEWRMASPQWGLDTFDMDWSSDRPLQGTAARDLLRAEARHRRHVERHELLERNERRWGELSCYRALVWRLSSPAIAVEEAAAATKEMAKNKEEGDEEVEAYTGGTLPTGHAAEETPRWSAADDAMGDDKENVAPRIDDPPPVAEALGTTQRSATAWCVDMTDGEHGTPPHLRDRPWAPMLTRQASCSKFGTNNNGSNIGRRAGPRAMERAALSRRGQHMASTFGADEKTLLVDTPSWHASNKVLQRTPETPPTKRSRAVLLLRGMRPIRSSSELQRLRRRREVVPFWVTPSSTSGASYGGSSRVSPECRRLSRSTAEQQHRF